MSCPLHSSPPKAGEGLVHVRLRVILATSPGSLFVQDFEQVDHSFQFDHPPSTPVNEKEILSFRMVMRYIYSVFDKV